MRAVGERTSDPSNVLVAVPGGLQLEGTQETTGSIYPTPTVHVLPTMNVEAKKSLST